MFKPQSVVLLWPPQLIKAQHIPLQALAQGPGLTHLALPGAVWWVTLISAIQHSGELTTFVLPHPLWTAEEQESQGRHTDLRKGSSLLSAFSGTIHLTFQSYVFPLWLFLKCA